MLTNNSGDSQYLIVQQHHEQHKKSESLTSGGSGGGSSGGEGRLHHTASGPRTQGTSHRRPDVTLFQSHIKKHSLDCSFISDSILALGCIEDAQLPVYQELLDHNEVLVWNLSGAAMSSGALEAFNQQGML